MGQNDVNAKIDAILSKTDELHHRVMVHDTKIIAIEGQCEWLESEIIRGRQLINEQLDKVVVKLDVLHDDNLLRKGKESVYTQNTEFNRQINFVRYQARQPVQHRLAGR